MFDVFIRISSHVWLIWEDIHNPDSMVYGANMGPIWDRQDPGGPHVGPMNFAIWEHLCNHNEVSQQGSGNFSALEIKWTQANVILFYWHVNICITSCMFILA